MNKQRAGGHQNAQIEDCYNRLH